MNRKLITCALLLVSAAVVGISRTPRRQQEHEGMAHGRTSLFVARMDGRAVVPGSGSDATGTAAFVFEVTGSEARLTYDVTYDGLRNGPPRAVRLRNFGAGGNGDVVHVICDAGAGAACPNSAGGTISGAWTSGDARPLTPGLVLELAAQRIYAEVESGPAGVREIRGQLSPPQFMAATRNFITKLRADGGAGVSGTGAFSLIMLGQRRRILLFDLTVTGLQAPVTAIRIPLPSALSDTPLTMQVKAEARKSSATVSGFVDAREMPVLLRDEAQRLMSAGELNVSVVTADRRVGELRSRLIPLR